MMLYNQLFAEALLRVCENIYICTTQIETQISLFHHNFIRDILSEMAVHRLVQNSPMNPKVGSSTSGSSLPYVKMSLNKTLDPCISINVQLLDNDFPNGSIKYIFIIIIRLLLGSTSHG